ncbi:double zinc ribbon domain-containing protein [Ruminococcus flavefaciens]|uniref:Double zinc ribbon n=1 Tax=Ruminococcus flavefaciens TaxID=1265 RepID=A0A1K1PSG3_RUMFL|nr:zinc ribbon domain-containing protein [Ruminococcus flavefaciens]SFW50405.1 Double zinc ribbon [Ruminococcus flavefaciens]
MALMNCPNCGKQISDKSTKCVHCDYELVKLEKRCPECQEIINEDTKICPKCGCPIEETKETSSKELQKVEVIKVRVDTKKIIIICIAVLILIGVVVGVIFGVKKYNNKKAEDLHVEQVNNYETNYKEVSRKMLSGAADAESCGNLIKKVWYNSIYEESDYETNKYTKSGSTYNDFNTSLRNLFADEDFSMEIEGIEKNQKEVADIMKQLKNPPDEWKDSYEVLKGYYDAYLTLTELATNPTGSLQSFSENFNNADSEVSKYYSKIKNEIS